MILLLQHPNQSKVFKCQTVNVPALPKIVFLVNPDDQNPTGDIIQVCLPLPPRASVKANKPNKKQKRKQIRQQQQQQLEHQGSVDDQKHFNYSVSYFAWAVSDSESDDDDDECQSITLPLSKLRIANKKETNQSKS